LTGSNGGDTGSATPAPGHLSHLRKDIFPALYFRDFRFLIGGAFVSSIGTWLQTTALLWFVREHTGADVWVGLANMVNWVPILLLGLFSGIIADYFNRKRVIVVTQATMSLSALSVGLVIGTGHISMPLIIALLAVGGIAYAFFVISWVATIPDLVSTDTILDAVALNNAQFNLARFVGPALGGLVLLWSVSAAFYINAFTFLCFIVFVLLSGVKIPHPPRGAGNTLAHIREGLRYVRSKPWMVRLLATVGVLSFFGYAYIVLIPATCKDVLGKGEGSYGLLMGMTGLGAVIGMPVVARLDRYLKGSTIIKMSSFSFAAFLLGFSASKAYWLSCLMAFGTGLSFLIFNSVATAILQARSRHDMVGRVMSLMIMVYLGVFPVGGIALGWLSDQVGVGHALLTGGLVCLAMASVLTLFPAFSREFVMGAEGDESRSS
jgi:MFS family permease